MTKCSRWHCFDANVYCFKAYMFIGSIKEMCDTSYSALRRGMDAVSAKKFSDKIKQMYLSDEKVGAKNDGCGVRVEIDSGVCIWIARIDRFRGSIKEIAVIAHECLHVALSIVDSFGVIEKSPFETLCYIHEAIYMDFIKYAFGSIGCLSYEEPKAHTDKSRNKARK